MKKGTSLSGAWAGWAPDGAPIANVVVFSRVVGVVVDRQQGAGLLGFASPAVVEIEAPRTAVDFQSRAGLYRFRDHRLHVEAGLPAAVETSGGRVGVDVHVWRS